MSTTATTSFCQCQLFGGAFFINGYCAYCNRPPSTATFDFNRQLEVVKEPEPKVEPPPRKGFRQKKRKPRPDPPPSFTERLVAKLDEGLSPEQVRMARNFTRRRRHRTQRR